jgi:hypothetical protein
MRHPTTFEKGRIMTEQEAEDFQWTYCIAPVGEPNAKPLDKFMRLADATEALPELSAQYPSIELSIFVKGDQVYYGAPQIHNQTH